MFLCGLEDEDIEHILMRCPALTETRAERINDIRHMYSEEGLQPPTTTMEVTSVILNGGVYRRDAAQETSNTQNTCSTQQSNLDDSKHV